MTHLYDNVTVFSTNDQLLFRCANKKAQWYLNKNLATKVQENPLVIKLKFTTSGGDKPKLPYYLQDFENKCVVCGDIENKLVRRHIVPECYPLPIPIVNPISHLLWHDLQLLCKWCDKNFQYPLYLEMERLAHLSLVPFSGITFNSRQMKAYSDIHALINSSDKIPETRKEILKNKIKNTLGYLPSDEEMLRIYEINKNRSRKPDVKAAKMVVDTRIQSLEDFDNFRIMWRYFFLDTMKPKFMPQCWNVEFKIAQDYFAGKIN